MHQNVRASTVLSWYPMNSPGHRSNIMSASFKSIGIGVFHQNGYYYYVQCFGVETGGGMAFPKDGTQKFSINVDKSIMAANTILMQRALSPIALPGKTLQYNAYLSGDWVSLLLDPASFTWSSSNSAVASVSSKGTVSALKKRLC